MKRPIQWLLLSLAMLLFMQPGKAQYADSLRKTYYADIKTVSKGFSIQYYPHRAAIYALGEERFLQKVDSLRQPYDLLLSRYSKELGQHDEPFLLDEARDIDYFFDKLILDYPYFHHNFTGKKVALSKSVQARLDLHAPDLNNPGLLKSRDVRNYIEAFLRHQSSMIINNKKYQASDNKRLDAHVDLTNLYFKNEVCRDYWQHYFLYKHLDNFGSKNTGKAIHDFLASCANERYKREIDSFYTESQNARNSHLIKTYKTVDGYNLDLHIFLPAKKDKPGPSPVIVYFSGGSWTEGSPEWAFYNCENYSRKGWVAVSVEYRIADRYETTPFEAVKDARSAIRWLKANAAVYGIDTNKIVASGNSAGGHLVLSTAMADDWNESTDDLSFSASPDLLIVQAGVYSLYADHSTDWVKRDLKDKNLGKKISPVHLVRPGLPPMLLFHGTEDQSVAWTTADAFEVAMKKLGNDVELHTLNGAPHHIWFDRRFSGILETRKDDFLRKHGF